MKQELQLLAGQLLHQLYTSSNFQFFTHIEHIPDDLSLNNRTSFLQHCQVKPEGTPMDIPPLLKDMLLSKTLDWISPTWRQWFRDTLKLV